MLKNVNTSWINYFKFSSSLSLQRDGTKGRDSNNFKKKIKACLITKNLVV